MKDLINRAPKWVWFVVAGLLVWLFIGRRLSAKVKLWLDVLRGNRGHGTALNLDNTATEIYAAFYANDWFKLTEDEQRAMKALLAVPKNRVPELASLYLKKYSKNLYTDFAKYLSRKQYDLVKSQLS